MPFEHVALHYPEAIKWMWNYCIYLGSYTDDCGEHYDLGVHINACRVSAAIVIGNTPGSYLSGELEIFAKCDKVYAETLKRAKVLELI